MCVIIIKPENLQITHDTIKKCHDSNPHGSGIAIRKDSKTFRVDKGIRLDELWNLVKTNMNKEMVIHFRLRSAGQISPEMCHPFPIDKNHNKLHYEAKSMLFHNGTLPQFMGTRTTNQEFSDSYRLSKILRKVNKSEKNALLNALSDRNKFVLIDRGKISTYGEWEIRNGLKFSNLYWDFDWWRKYYHYEVKDSKKIIRV